MALLLVLVMLSASVFALNVPAFAESEGDDIIKGEFIYAPHTYPDGDLSDIYYYSDGFFSGSATEYNEHLATASMILAAASISSQELDGGAFDAALNSTMTAFESAGEVANALLEIVTANGDEDLQNAIKEVSEDLNAARAELSEAIADGGKIAAIDEALDAVRVALEIFETVNEFILENAVANGDEELQAEIDLVTSDIESVKNVIAEAVSFSNNAIEGDYTTKSVNLSNLLREWDFVGFDTNDYYMERPGEQTMGVGMAYKIIGEGDDAYTVLAIVPRSAGYQREWAGNFTVGKKGLHQGFAAGRDIILEYAKEYVADKQDMFEGEVKIWTVGYSRGAGVGNLLAAYLDDDIDALGIDVKKENIFAYTFGTPSNVDYKNDTEKASLENNYPNIFNHYAEYDIVTYAPFKNWGFTYYGKTILFDVHNAEKKAEMLKFLEKTNKTIYDLYTAENSSADPDNFTAVMLQAGLDGSFGFVPADESYGIPTDQKEFLDSRIEFLVNNLVPDRETYVDGGYEHALQRLTSLYFGLNSKESALLFKGMSHDVPTLAAAYYCYFISEFYLGTEEGMTAAVALVESLPQLEQYVASLAANEEATGNEWYAYASAFIAGEEYARLKATLTAICSNVETLEANLDFIQSTIKTFAVGMTAKVLGGGVTAIIPTDVELTEEEQEEYNTLLATMTSPEVAGPLTDFFVYLLLGTEDGSALTAFEPSNKNVALAATFLTNAGRYMRVHNNEIILSWLRTSDNYYSNETWHVHKLDVKYDENGHWEECACGYKESVCEHTFSDWEYISVAEGEKEMVSRRCPCGYSETKEAPEIKLEKEPMDVRTVVIVCVGAAVIVAAIVVTAVVVKKRKKTK